MNKHRRERPDELRKNAFSDAWMRVDPAMHSHPCCKTFVSNTRILFYWQKHGWAGRCEPLDGGHLVCR